MDNNRIGRPAMNNGRGIMTALAIVLCLVAAGAAQNSQALTPQARQKLEALRVWRLTQELNLSEDQSAQFFPKLKTMREMRQQYRQNRAALLSDLSKAVQLVPLDQVRIRLLVDSVAAMDANLIAAEAAIRHDLNEILTLEQQARFILFQANFDNEMRKMIEQIKHDRGVPGTRK